MAARGRDERRAGRARGAIGPLLAATGIVALCVGGIAGAGTAVAGAAAGAATGIPNPTHHVYAYVTDETVGYVSVIDTQATPPKLMGTIPLSLGTPARCGLKVFATDTGRADPTLAACPPTTHPIGITASPTGTLVYVDSYGSTTVIPNGAIDVISAATNEVIRVIPLTANPIASAVSPGGTTLYVAAHFAPTDGQTHYGIETIHLSATPAVVTRVTVPSYQFIDRQAPGAVTVGEGGKAVALSVTGDTGGAVDVFSVKTTGKLTPTYTPLTLLDEVPSDAVTASPSDPGIAYSVMGFTTPNASNTAAPPYNAISVVTLSHPSTGSNRVTLLPNGGAATDLADIAVSPDGATVAITGVVDGTTSFVSSLTVPPGTPTHPVPISTETDANGRVPLTPGADPIGLAFTPDGAALYVAEHDADQVAVLDAITKVVASVTLKSTFPAGVTPGLVHPVAVSFAAPAAPHVTPPVTTTTTAPVTPTTTVSPTTGPPAATVAPRTAAELAFTGFDVGPWLWIGGSLAIVGGLLMGVDLWWRRMARRAHHRR